MARSASRSPATRSKRAVLAPEDALPPPAGPVPQWPGHRLQIDGSTSFVRLTPATTARAEPAVYVHGLGGSSTNWTDLAGLLAGYLDGVALDLPGYGFSDPAPRYAVTALAERVIRLIEHAGRGPVHLLGNSLGGTVAVVVAATRPELVRTLTLISPALPFLNPRRSLQSRIVPLLAVPGGTRIAKRLLATLPPERLAQQVLDACFAEPGRLTEQRLAEAIEEVRLRYTTEHYVTAYLRTMRGLVTSFLRAYLPGEGSLWRTATAVRAPTLVIGGRQDRLVDIRVAPQTAYAIPDSRLLMLDGVGHVAQMEVPRVVARAVVAMLAEIGARSEGVAD